MAILLNLVKCPNYAIAKTTLQQHIFRKLVSSIGNYEDPNLAYHSRVNSKYTVEMCSFCDFATYSILF